MPASPDARLVARDSYLPGLATILDPQRLSERLAPRVARRTGSATLRLTTNYVRYKPATSCLVGYDLRIGCGQVSLYAKTFRSSADLKFAKARTRKAVQSPLGSSYLALEEDAIVIAVFPNDAKLRALRHLFDPTRPEAFLRSVLDVGGVEPSTAIQTRALAYKPERRYVCSVETGGRVRAILKLFRPGGLPGPATREIARTIHARGRDDLRLPVVPVEIASSRRRGWIAFDYIEGRCLEGELTGGVPISRTVETVGAALAEFHRVIPRGAWQGGGGGKTAACAELKRLVGMASWLSPQDADRAVRLASRIEEGLGTGESVPIHGDFYAKQVLIGDRIGFLDLDRAGPGSPGRDIACFLAHLVRDRLRGSLRPERAETAAEALLDGYTRRAGALPADLAAHRALALFSLWADPFRKREVAWDRRAAELLAEAERCLEPRARPLSREWNEPFGMGLSVHDVEPPARDAELPALDSALSLPTVLSLLRTAQLDCGPVVAVRRAELLRHKVGRRALIAYDVDLADGSREAWIGKLRSRGTDHRTLDLNRMLLHAGFAPGAHDGVQVPEPLGVVEGLGMWLQRRVPGRPSTEWLDPRAAGQAALGARLGSALAKLHANLPPIARVHRLGDEVAGLEDRLRAWERDDPGRAPHVSALRSRARSAGQALDDTVRTLIHRDFHLDQALLAADGRIWLVDLDLAAVGDPALDVGNFSAHLIELGLRRYGDPSTFSEVVAAFESAWRAQSGDRRRFATGHYRTLALIRLTALARTYREREHTVDAMLELCLERTAPSPGQAIRSVARRKLVNPSS